MEYEVVIKNLYKAFGRQAKIAVSLAEKGYDKLEILKKTGSILALNNISLNIPKGKVFSIIGLSGSGKSTLVRHINRLIDPDKGAILVHNQDVLQLSLKNLEKFRQNKISMVFQKFGLFPHWTVQNNVAYGLLVKGMPAKKAYEIINPLLDSVGLLQYKSNYPDQLSGGMQQRVGLARAFATNTDIILMDEPFSALDPLIKSDMQDLLNVWQAKNNKTIIFITHDIFEALRLGDNIAVLKDGQLVQSGPAEQIKNNPVDDYVAKLVDSIYLKKSARQ